MTTLKIQNVGPLLSAYVEFKKCTLFIGEQGAGKVQSQSCILCSHSLKRDC